MNSSRKKYHLEKGTGSSKVFWQIALSGKQETQITEGHCEPLEQHKLPPEAHASPASAIKYLQQQVRLHKRRGYTFPQKKISSGGDLRNKLSRNRQARADHVRDTVARLRGDLDSAMAARDSDTDSVASSSASFQFNLEKRRAQEPQKRRRSLRLEEKMAVAGTLRSQGTVVMKSIKKPHLVKMETSAIWRLRDPALRLVKQDTSDASPALVNSLDVDDIESTKESPVKRSMLRKQTTTTGIRNALLNTKLESIAEAPNVSSLGKDRFKRKAFTDNDGPSLSNPQCDTTRRRLKRKATSQTSSNETSCGKRRKAESLSPTEPCLSEHSIYIPPFDSWPLKMKAPVVLTIPLEKGAGCPKRGMAIHVDSDRCILGDEDGTVLAFDSRAEFRYMMKLASGVKCFLPDGDFLYAGCNNGSVYDISHMIPQLACRIDDFGKVLSMTMYSGLAAMSDDRGHLAVVDSQGALQWQTKSPGVFGWMVCMDKTGVYHGHSAGITKYKHLMGRKVWHADIKSPVRHGIQTDQMIYVACGDVIRKYCKKTDTLLHTYNAGSNQTSDVHCVAVACGLVTAAGNKIVCYDESTGDMVYVIDTATAPDAMQYYNGRLFCMGLGGLVAVELTEDTVKSILAGNSLDVHTSIPDALAPTVLPVKEVDDVTSCEPGKVVVECIAPKKGKKGTLKARALSLGFKANSAVKLPDDLMQEGARYVVDELKVDSASSYTAHGHIQKIISTNPHQA